MLQLFYSSAVRNNSFVICVTNVLYCPVKDESCCDSCDKCFILAHWRLNPIVIYVANMLFYYMEEWLCSDCHCEKLCCDNCFILTYDRCGKCLMHPQWRVISINVSSYHIEELTLLWYMLQIFHSMTVANVLYSQSKNLVRIYVMTVIFWHSEE
jgi:hypothetical protein